MKRDAKPPLSSTGQQALSLYEQTLREREDLSPASIRNYLSDDRHFMVGTKQERSGVPLPLERR